MKQYKKILAFPFLFILPFCLQAQPKWELKECLEYGLKNHGSIRVAENTIRNADEQRREALAAYLPGVSGTGKLIDNVKPQVTVIPAGAFSPTDIKVAFTKRYNTNGYVELNQAIYDQTALTGLKAAKYNKEDANLNRQQTDESIIYNVSAAYYQVFIYKAQLQSLWGDSSTYAGQVQVAQLQLQKGVTAEVDVNKIQVNLNNTLSNINTAQSNLDVSIVQLKNAMGFPVDQPLPLDTSFAAKESPVQLLGMLDSSRFSAGNKTEVRQSQNNLSLLDIDARRIRAGGLPSLSVNAQYGAIGFGDKPGESFDGMSAYATVGLTLKVPLFDGFKRNAQYKQARYKQQNAVENLKLDTAKYRVDYENAKTKLIKAQANVDNDQRNIQLAQSVFSSTNLQYQKGVTDLTDWLDALRSLREAQNSYLNSLYSFYTAGLDLEKAAGTLKNFYSSL